jgi:hypothetical protein
MGKTTKNLGTDKRILKWIFRDTGWVYVNWIHLAQVRDK